MNSGRAGRNGGLFGTGRGIAGVASLAMVAAALLFAVAPPAIPADPQSQPISVAAPVMPPPLAAGPTPDLDLLFTAQVVGWVEPCG